MRFGALDERRGGAYTAGMKKFLLPVLALFIVGTVLTGCDDDKDKDKKAEDAAAAKP